MSDSAEPRRSTWPEATVITVLVLAVLAYFLTTLGGEDDSTRSSSLETVTLSQAEIKKLKATSTFTTVKRAGTDEGLDRDTTGRVAHPKQLTAVFDEPAGTPIAKLHKKQSRIGGNDTWVPIIEERDGWLKVMLPSRPNASVGWIQTRDVETARSRHLVRVHTGSRTVQLFEDGSPVGEWPAAVGKADTPTPTGRTFILGQFTDASRPDLLTVIPLGMHSETHETYGGGPGTVAFHGWTTNPAVFGQAISEGCIRLPEEALAKLRTVPLGTTVLIDND